VTGDTACPGVRCMRSKTTTGMVKLLDEFPNVHKPSISGAFADHSKSDLRRGNREEPFLRGGRDSGQGPDARGRRFRLQYLFRPIRST